MIEQATMVTVYKRWPTLFFRAWVRKLQEKKWGN